MGGNTISNGSYLWSCCRYSSNFAWDANGGYGVFNYGILYGELSAVPVSLYIL